MGRTIQMQANVTGTKHSAPRHAFTRFVGDERGVVMNEYVVLTGFVGLVAIPSFALLGYVVAHSYSFMQGYLLFMLP